MKSTILSTAAGAAACMMLMSAAAQAQAQFTMKLSSPTINEVSHEWMKAMKAGIEQRSGGKIKVELYPANQLGQLPATIEGVALGTIELSRPAVGFIVGLEPRFQVFEAPGINLATSFDRIQPSYFRRWLRAPTSVDPSTKMPGYFDEEGKSPLPDVLGGDGPKTIGAVWEYLRLADKMPRPE